MILSNRHAEIASTFFVPIMHSREVARKVMNLARIEPEKVLAVLPTLPKEVQRELTHLRVIAMEAMGNKEGRNQVITAPATATGRKAEKGIEDLLDRFEGLLSGTAIRNALKLRN